MTRSQCITVFFLFSQRLIAQDIAPTGQWAGEISKDGKNWKTEITISLNGKIPKGYFNLPDYGLYHLTFDTIYAGPNDKIRLEYKDKRDRAVFAGTIAGTTITGDWEGLGLKATFSVLKKSNEGEELKIEEVLFYHAGARISGTLILPVGKGPFPAVVQVHGSGNQTRSEEFYLSRAFLFAKNGIATLVYDRRGKGKSTGDDISMELLADDAIAGIHLLQQRSDIKRKQIGIMGFSQGGYVSPLAASRSSDVAFVIAGAAPGICPDEQNDFNIENELRGERVAEDTIALVLNLRKEIRKYQYSSLGNQHDLAEQLKSIKNKTWFPITSLTESIQPVSAGVKDWLTFDPLLVWAKVKVPVLLVWGELDDAVPVEKSKVLIEKALKSAGNKAYFIKIFPNSGHGILLRNTSKEWDWPRLAPGYHQLLIDWTNQITKK